MKKLTALLLCLVLCVSMFAACGDGEPVDTTKSATPSTTAKPDVTTKPEENETTLPQTPDSSEETPDTSEDEPVTPPAPPAVGLEELIPELPIDEQLAKDAIGSKDAGVVADDYTPIKDTVAISSLAEITDPTGKYYLTADISANETTIAEFYGILDCCGHKITTSEPLFAKLGGAVVNLTLAGDISYSVEAKSPLANEIVSNAIILNVKNEANITVAETSTEVGVLAGGFAINLTGENVVFANCEFAGTIVNEYAAGGNNRKTGGFVGMIMQTSEDDAVIPEVDFIYCTVSGSVKASSHTGGIIGESTNGATLNVAGCLSAGTITASYEGAAGGLIGYLSGDQSGFTTIVNCVNDGTVTSNSDFGGIAGCLNASGSVNMTEIKWCVNYKPVTGKRYGGGIAGELRGKYMVEACVNFADIESTCIIIDGQPDPTKDRHYVGGIVGLSQKGGSELQNTWKDCVNYGDLDAASTNNRLGGILGHSQSTWFRMDNCVNFGDLTSNFVAPDAATGDHRIGGVTGGGNSNQEFYNCVNFGDMRIQMGKWGQPSGGITGYVTNSGDFAMVNCLNYGDLDVTVPTLVSKENYNNTAAAGLAGRVTGINPITVKNCLNAGELKSDFIVANFINWEKAEGFIVDDMVISNNYYIAQTVKDGQLYGNFLYDDLGTGGLPNKNNKVYEAFQTEACGKAITKANIEDSTTAGLAAVMNAGAGEALFQYAEVKMTDGITVVKCVIPVAISELIAADIVS